MTLQKPAATGQPLWSVPAPQHFDSAIPAWIKISFMLILLAAAFPLDAPIARWAFAKDRLPTSGDISRELIMLEQFGQWVGSILLIAAVALIDRAGRRKALALSIACLITVLLGYLLKDLSGRGRPTVFFNPLNPNTLPFTSLGFRGPAFGFASGNHYSFGSFPSSHTTGAFALATGLSWFYPRARGLFLTLALIVAAQRILHHEHFLSDTLAGILLSVTTVRLCLSVNLAGKLIHAMPASLETWWLRDSAHS